MRGGQGWPVIARLQDFLALQAQARPERTALVFRGKPLTYGGLERASNRLARALQSVSCSRGDRVALLLPKTPRALIGMLGVLKAGGIYVPIDTLSPAARIERILRLCECRCVLAESSTAALLGQLMRSGAVCGSSWPVWMDEGGEMEAASMGWQEVQEFSADPVEVPGGPFDPAHILFTSGSTGEPKGVIITHSNVIAFVNWAVRYFGISAGERISGHPPLHFDLSTFDIFGTIAAGAELHLMPPEISLIPHRLADFIRDSELNQWFSVPSALVPLAKHDVLKENDFPALRRLLWCGEKFPTPGLIYCMRRLPHVSFTNLYGPTEATIASSYYQVPHCPEEETAEIPIGAPCEGETLLVLDEHLDPCEPGQVGDLYIGGVGLSPGYWRDAEKTARVFVRDPRSGERIYKTGDLARVGLNGLVYLLGRSDSQIKRRGYRIELGEIEAALHAAKGLEDAAVVAVEEQDGDVSIACAYVPASGCDVAPASLKKQLALALPPYMIPTRWMTLTSMPHNGNGKTDRVQIKQRFEAETRQAAAAGLNPSARTL
jgi:amino acid adenylation domain-containing protein